MPVTWQGWLTIAVFIVVNLVVGYIAEVDDAPGLSLLTVLVSIAILYAITSRHAPKPKWRWGKKPDDDPDTDF